MTTTATQGTSAPATWSTRNKVGLALAIVYAITNIPSAFVPPDTGGEDGPPMAILWVCTVLSVIALVAGVMAWRTGSRPAARLTAASLIVVTLTGLPAFFVDVPAGIKILVAAGVVITVVFTLLIFSPAKRG
ncbi:hypothetical protein EUA93_08880 [Nocardioides oleivorans]|uniref:Uncharacterized protein n=1 Tax=Nocardioides oleivorans TaxID=273676 RepID=A0A4Q2RZY8_9ACTN|nr:hypothetical protein [Nocardioides oleivorans]RYB94446.1 hypothetical protein EUA93_08880 [Nocardioides oleivorans]